MVGGGGSLGWELSAASSASNKLQRPAPKMAPDPARLGVLSPAVAAAFIFCARSPPLTVPTACPVDTEAPANSEAVLPHAKLPPSLHPRLDLTAALRLPDLDLPSSIALLLPLAAATHCALAGSGGAVAAACVPIAIPFSVPQVSPDAWLANKRARAFHRCCVVCVYAQGAIAVLKFARGDLVGGTYDALQALMGGYAIQPDGQRFFPTYIVISGFNGLLGLFQVFQSFQGVPLHFLPMLALLPPAFSLMAAYCGWQFCREVNAIAAGLTGDGPQDSCFVRCIGGDWWPSSIGPSYSGSTAGDGGVGVQSAPSRFSAFAGDGRRLGEA